MTTTTRKPAVNTAPYFGSHLREPRGTGCWAFCPSDRYRDYDYLSHTQWFKGTYAAAKRQAREAFAGKTPEIVTLP